MKRLLPFAVVVASVLALATSAAAEDKAAAGVLKKEASAGKKCAAELIKSAKALTKLGAHREARNELRVALSLAPGDTKALKALSKLLTELTDTPEEVEEKVDALSAKAHEKCAKLILPVLAKWEKAERPEHYGDLATRALAGLGDEGPLEALDVAWFEEYLMFARTADVERWKKGDEFLDGKWLTADEVKAADAAHADWKDPWRISDGIHEVRTNMPLRAAKRVLLYVRAYRQFVHGELAAEWEWTPSKDVLPIYLTSNQADYTARLTDYDPVAAKSKASAIYVQKTGGLCPVFVTFEPKVVGAGTRIGWDSIVRDIRHEVGHQILYEACMAGGAGVGGPIDWVSEGIANYLAAHRPRKGKWRLARVSQEPYADGKEPGPFAWTKGNFGSVKPLSEYVTNTHNLGSAYEYFVATTLIHFLLDGQNGKYRASTIKLLLEVHNAKGTSSSFGKCFPKTDFAAMQDEWAAFVRGMSIRDR